MRAADGFTSMIRCAAGSMTRIPVWTASKRAFRYSSWPVDRFCAIPAVCGSRSPCGSRSVVSEVGVRPSITSSPCTAAGGYGAHLTAKMAMHEAYQRPDDEASSRKPQATRSSNALDFKLLSGCGLLPLSAAFSVVKKQRTSRRQAGGIGTKRTGSTWQHLDLFWPRHRPAARRCSGLLGFAFPSCTATWTRRRGRGSRPRITP